MTSTLPLYILLFLSGALVAFLLFYMVYSRARRRWQAESESIEEVAEQKQAQLTQELNDLMVQCSRQEQKIELEEESRRTLEEHYKSRLQEQEGAFQRQITSMEAQFKSLSEDITKKRTEELTTSNRTNMEAILTPLKMQIELMEKAFKENREKTSEQTTRMDESIRNLLERSMQVEAQASNLAAALRQKGKIQGDWGETILSNLLEQEGLVEGIAYSTQVNLKGGGGNNFRPDVIIHYPDNRDLIVDAKVSLTAYVNYYEAEDEQQKQKALDEHISSMQKHVKELVSKKYHALIEPPKQSLDYVLMFVPISGALQLVLEHDKSFWRSALEAGVFVVDDRNLLAILRIVSSLWRQYDQERNVDEIIKHAEFFVERTAGFLDQFSRVRDRIDQLQKELDAAEIKFNGNRGLLGSARKIVELGVKNTSKHPLPEPVDDVYPQLSEAEFCDEVILDE